MKSLNPHTLQALVAAAMPSWRRRAIGAKPAVCKGFYRELASSQVGILDTEGARLLEASSAT